jgi:hypothetical protein
MTTYVTAKAISILKMNWSFFVSCVASDKWKVTFYETPALRSDITGHWDVLDSMLSVDVTTIVSMWVSHIFRSGLIRISVIILCNLIQEGDNVLISVVTLFYFTSTLKKRQISKSTFLYCRV